MILNVCLRREVKVIVETETKILETPLCCQIQQIPSVVYICFVVVSFLDSTPFHKPNVRLFYVYSSQMVTTIENDNST